MVHNFVRYHPTEINQFKEFLPTTSKLKDNEETDDHWIQPPKCKGSKLREGETGMKGLEDT